jgi:hypothetical protein
VIFSEFIKSYRKGVNISTGKAFSLRALAELIAVDQWRLQKWEQGIGSPKDESDRIKVKNFFGIDLNNEELSEQLLKSAIERYPHAANPMPEAGSMPTKLTGDDIRRKKAIGTDDTDPGLI